MWNGIRKYISLIPLIAAISGALIVSYIIYFPQIPRQFIGDVGDISNQTVRAPHYIEFQTSADIAKTNDLIASRRQLIKPIYVINTDVQKGISDEIISLFTTIQELKQSDTPLTVDFLSENQLAILNQYSQPALIQLEADVQKTLTHLLQSGIKDINRFNVTQKIQQLWPAYSPQSMDILESIVLTYLRPNLVVDDLQTQAIIDQQMAAIKPFFSTFKSGQVIIAKGETITSNHISALQELKLYKNQNKTFHFAGILIITTLLFISFERFIYIFYRKIHKNPSVYLLTYTLLFLNILLALLIYSLPAIKYADTLHFLIPVPVMVILLSLLLTPNIAMLSGTICAILIAMMYQNTFSIFLFLFFATTITTFSCYKVYKRSDLVFSGNIIGIFNSLVIICIGFLSDITQIVWYLYNVIIGFSSGFICAMISFAFLPYFESIFRITTPLGLLETANLNHPLLKRLLLNAPGTYQHSLMVANLSEAAAEAIGADVVLCRICAYFHDIGKMKRPIFFYENQFSNENPHDNLSPRMSKIVIAAHTKDGVEMAMKYKLPRIIQDIIMQHHGTSLVSFFYDAAKQNRDGESLKEDFRYPGPKPQTKEAGIIMLADTTEAAIRSIDKPTLTKIENLIDKVFTGKIMDNQLNESGLSLNNIQTIKSTFFKIFKSIYHSRLDYDIEIAKIIDQTKGKHNDA
jgi:putative nucleotidyltransferase with HDIG domain